MAVPTRLAPLDHVRALYKEAETLLPRDRPITRKQDLIRAVRTATASRGEGGGGSAALLGASMDGRGPADGWGGSVAGGGKEGDELARLLDALSGATTGAHVRGGGGGGGGGADGGHPPTEKALKDLEVIVNAAAKRYNEAKRAMAARQAKLTNLRTEWAALVNENVTLCAVESRTKLLSWMGGAGRKTAAHAPPPPPIAAAPATRGTGGGGGHTEHEVGGTGTIRVLDAKTGRPWDNPWSDSEEDGDSDAGAPGLWGGTHGATTAGGTRRMTPGVSSAATLPPPTGEAGARRLGTGAGRAGGSGWASASIRTRLPMPSLPAMHGTGTLPSSTDLLSSLVGGGTLPGQVTLEVATLFPGTSPSSYTILNTHAPSTTMAPAPASGSQSPGRGPQPATRGGGGSTTATATATRGAGSGGLAASASAPCLPGPRDGEAMDGMGMASGGRTGKDGPGGSWMLTPVEVAEVERIRALRHGIKSVRRSMTRREFTRRQYEHMAGVLRSNAASFERHMKGLDDAIRAARKEIGDVSGYLRLLEASRDAAVVELHKVQGRLTQDKLARQRDLEERRLELGRAQRMEGWRKARAAVRAEMRAELMGDLSKEQEEALIRTLQSKEAAVAVLVDQHTERQQRANVLHDAFLRIKAATGVQTVEEMVQRFVSLPNLRAALQSERAEVQARLASAREDHVQAQAQYAAAMASAGDVGGSGGGTMLAAGDDSWRQEFDRLQRLWHSARQQYRLHCSGVARLEEALLCVRQGAVAMATMVEPFRSAIAPGAEARTGSPPSPMGVAPSTHIDAPDSPHSSSGSRNGGNSPRLLDVRKHGSDVARYLSRVDAATVGLVTTMVTTLKAAAARALQAEAERAAAAAARETAASAASTTFVLTSVPVATAAAAPTLGDDAVHGMVMRALQRVYEPGAVQADPLSVGNLPAVAGLSPSTAYVAALCLAHAWPSCARGSAEVPALPMAVPPGALGTPPPTLPSPDLDVSLASVTMPSAPTNEDEGGAGRDMLTPPADALSTNIRVSPVMPTNPDALDAVHAPASLGGGGPSRAGVAWAVHDAMGGGMVPDDEDEAEDDEVLGVLSPMDLRTALQHVLPGHAPGGLGHAGPASGRDRDSAVPRLHAGGGGGTSRTGAALATKATVVGSTGAAQSPSVAPLHPGGVSMAYLRQPLPRSAGSASGSTTGVDLATGIAAAMQAGALPIIDPVPLGAAYGLTSSGVVPDNDDEVVMERSLLKRRAAQAHSKLAHGGHTPSHAGAMTGGGMMPAGDGGTSTGSFHTGNLGGHRDAVATARHRGRTNGMTM